jgi:hypothetical protein
MRTTIVTLALLAAPRAALACPVCFGQNDTAMGNAVKAGVILMLVLVGLVLAGFAAFIVQLNRRARMFAEDPAPPDAGRYAQKGTV